MSVPEAPTWAPVPEELARLAGAYGVATEYWDQAGALVQVGEATVAAVLRALGLDVSSREAIEAALEEKRLRDWRRMLPPVFVMRQGEDQRLWVHVPDGRPARAWIVTEDGAPARPRPDGLLGRVRRRRRDPHRRGQLPGARRPAPGLARRACRVRRHHRDRPGGRGATAPAPRGHRGRPPVGPHDAGVRDAVHPVVGHRRPARPRRPRRRGADAISAPASSSSTRCTPPRPCRRWPRRPTCR